MMCRQKEKTAEMFYLELAKNALTFTDLDETQTIPWIYHRVQSLHLVGTITILEQLLKCCPMNTMTESLYQRTVVDILVVRHLLQRIQSTYEKYRHMWFLSNYRLGNMSGVLDDLCRTHRTIRSNVLLLTTVSKVSETTRCRQFLLDEKEK